MLIRNLTTKVVYEVPDGTTYPKTAYEVVTKEQLEKEKAAKSPAKAPQEKKTITQSSPKKNPTKAVKKKPSAKKKK